MTILCACLSSSTNSTGVAWSFQRRILAATKILFNNPALKRGALILDVYDIIPPLRHQVLEMTHKSMIVADFALRKYGIKNA